jgi:hypothetical protein
MVLSHTQFLLDVKMVAMLDNIGCLNEMKEKKCIFDNPAMQQAANFASMRCPVLLLNTVSSHLFDLALVPCRGKAIVIRMSGAPF